MILWIAWAQLGGSTALCVLLGLLSLGPRAPTMALSHGWQLLLAVSWEIFLC